MITIIRRTTTALLTLVLALFLPLLAWAAKKDIIILHTNDIHCGINDNIGMAGLVQLKKAKRAQTPYVALVDAGDAVQGAPIGKLSQGLAVVKLMNAAGYDFAIPGNHEFDYGMNSFFKLGRRLDCGYYSANFLNTETNENILPSYKIMKFGDVKVGFIGVTTPETLISSTPAYFQNAAGSYIYTFCEDAEGDKIYRKLQRTINKVREEGADYVVLVAHLGVNGTIKRWSSPAVAQNTRGVNIIIDAHSHEKFEGMPIKNYLGRDVLIAQTGTKMQSIGQITITPTGLVSSELLENAQSNDARMEKRISREIKKYDELLRQPVGETATALCCNDPVTGERLVRKGGSNLADFVADAYRMILQADVAIVNGGSLRADIAAGAISYNDLLTVLPFGNTGVVAEATGQQILDALEMGAHKYPEENGGFLHVSGMSYTIDSSVSSSVQMDERGNFIGVSGQYRVQNVLIDGVPLDKQKLYKVGGTAYHLKSGGDGMSIFKNCRILQESPQTDADMIKEYLSTFSGGKIGNQYANPYGDGRISIKK